MKAVKATYQDGKITLSEIPPEPGPMEVLVVFPEATDDPWESILSEATPRPAFVKFAQKCRDKIAKGKAEPLDPRPATMILSNRQLDAFDNPARAACRKGNLHALREGAFLLWEDGDRDRSLWLGRQRPRRAERFA